MYMEEKDKKTRQAFKDFIEAINAKDVDKLCSMMVDYHEFVDSLGNSVKGLENLRNAWAGYFKMVPDYRLEISKILVDDSHIIATGVASGTFSPDGLLDPSNQWTPLHCLGKQVVRRSGGILLRFC